MNPTDAQRPPAAATPAQDHAAHATAAHALAARMKSGRPVPDTGAAYRNALDTIARRMAITPTDPPAAAELEMRRAMVTAVDKRTRQAALIRGLAVPAEERRELRRIVDQIAGAAIDAARRAYERALEDRAAAAARLDDASRAYARAIANPAAAISTEPPAAIAWAYDVTENRRIVAGGVVRATADPADVAAYLLRLYGAPWIETDRATTLGGTVTAVTLESGRMRAEVYRALSQPATPTTDTTPDGHPATA